MAPLRKYMAPTALPYSECAGGQKIKRILQKIHGEIQLPYGVRILTERPYNLQRGFRNLHRSEGDDTYGIGIMESEDRLVDLFQELIGLAGKPESWAEVSLLRFSIRNPSYSPPFIRSDPFELRIIQSMVEDYRQLLTQDGCVQFHVLRDLFGPNCAQVVLTRDKWLMVRTRTPAQLALYRNYLRSSGTPEILTLSLVSEFAHRYCTTPSYERAAREFERKIYNN